MCVCIKCSKNKIPTSDWWTDKGVECRSIYHISRNFIVLHQSFLLTGNTSVSNGINKLMFNCIRLIIIICKLSLFEGIHLSSTRVRPWVESPPWLRSFAPSVTTVSQASPFSCNLEILGGFTEISALFGRRKFRSETSDNMDSWKAEVRRVRREKIRRKKMQMREKVGKSRFTVFFQWFVAPEGRKVGSLKRRVRSQLARWEMNNCTPLWREAHFEVKMYKTHQVRTTFGSWDVEKVYAVVAQSTFRSQNVQNTSAPDHFLKLRCRKSARRCGAKHISKWKCTKHTNLGPLFEVAMSKKCTPLWREAHFEVKMYKTHHVRTTFGGSDVDFRKSARRCGAKHISKSKCTKHTTFGPLLEVEMSSFEKVHAVVARSTFRSQNVKNIRVLDHFWRFRCRFASLHFTTLHYTSLH